MKNAILFDFLVDKENHKITVKRSFDAPLDLVWAAWTDPDILDLWWAPKPWRTETKSLDFREGGRWHYAMVGPEGDRQWCIFDYKHIVPQRSYSGQDAFCDENAVADDTKPIVKWLNQFEETEDESTVVDIELAFANLQDLESLIQMGFKEGFTMGMENLDEYIKAQFYLRKQKKPDNKPRVATYLNFPGNTEEAFNFYKDVFQSEFVAGIQRFDQVPSEPGQPQLDDHVKRMILHVELPILGGHILMGTDAPKEMGFTVTVGNNMHIQLEPETREETERIFNGLSAGGTVSMALQDMFWGAYFGSFTDKFGINWMVNCQPK
ncbi:SRPBCC domain-containing protein [Algoriphagus terrigena]|uniref:SRPBCC domain-containing protein n=1 Tax=Algoriphagus terrigena TaxID=344884 RepID=UPI0004010B4E|nr:SRPBCC domain-containing protein [Algoriphagus terrigena]